MQENGGMQKDFNTAALVQLPPNRPKWMEMLVFFFFSFVINTGVNVHSHAFLSFFLHSSSSPEHLQPPVHQQIAPGLSHMYNTDANR